MTLNGVMAVTLRYFTEFGKLALHKTICGGICARVYCILVRVQCRRKESSRSLSHDEFLVLDGTCRSPVTYLTRKNIGNIFRHFLWRFLFPVCEGCGFSVGDHCEYIGILSQEIWKLLIHRFILIKLKFRHKSLVMILCVLQRGFQWRCPTLKGT